MCALRCRCSVLGVKAVAGAPTDWSEQHATRFPSCVLYLQLSSREILSLSLLQVHVLTAEAQGFRTMDRIACPVFSLASRSPTSHHFPVFGSWRTNAPPSSRISSIIAETTKLFSILWTALEYSSKCSSSFCRNAWLPAVQWRNGQRVRRHPTRLHTIMISRVKVEGYEPWL
jgi:hypothetical protein